VFENSLPDKTVFQICVIVDDIDRYAENYRTILGFDVPSDVQTTLLQDHTQGMYYGKPLNARAKIVSWMMGRVAFELLQPLDEPSEWMDYLKKHGPGVHHIAFNVPRTAPAAAHFADKGYQVTQQGLFTGRTGMYAYFDTAKDLGLTVELLEHYHNGHHPNPKPFPADKGIGTDVVCQIGLVTDDIEAMAKRYRDVLDLPEPNWVQMPGYKIVETTFYGQATEATAKLAFFDFGQVQLELIQPDNIPSVWRNVLNEKGDCVHHIAFQVNTDRAVEHFAQHGIGIAQQGLYGDRKGIYTYMDTQAQLGTIIELLESFPVAR